MGRLELRIRVTPNAKREEVSTDAAGLTKAFVRAPAIDGRANEALIKLLSKEYGVPKSRISITRGISSRNKTVEIET
jgi:uncharacterized protein (TIGR00251 family)